MPIYKITFNITKFIQAPNESSAARIFYKILTDKLNKNEFSDDDLIIEEVVK